MSIIRSSLLPPSRLPSARAALPLLIAGSLLLKAAWGGLPPFGSLGTQNNDMFFTFVNGNHSKDTVLLTAPGEMMPQ